MNAYSYNPQRYNAFYWNSGIAKLYGHAPRHLNLSPALGMKASLLDALKNMPNLSSLTINFLDWDPFDPANDSSTAVESSSEYESHLHGLVGFKNLEELVILGIMDGNRLDEVGSVVKDCLLSNKPGRRLKRIEMRAHTGWWDSLEMEEDPFGAHEILSCVDEMWDTCFPPLEEFRMKVRGLSLVDINVIFEFGPTKWQFNYNKASPNSCWENITALDLQGLCEIYISETIDMLAEKFRLRQPQHLRVFAVTCRIGHLNAFLEHCHGLKELYVLDPDATDSSSISDAIDIEGIHQVFDTISKRHLLTLEVLVVEEVIYTPRSGGTSDVINPIEGWKERGGKLRELAVNVWGPWEEISQFLSAFQNLKAIRLFSRRRNKKNTEKSFPWPIFESTFVIHGGNLYDAQTTAVAVMLANTWGRDVIRGKNGMGSLIPEGHRWIWVGDCTRPWKWHTHDAEKYAGWMNLESQLWFKYYDRDSSRFKWRVWEKEVKMSKILRQGGILIHSSEEFEVKWEGCCDGCSTQLDNP